MNYPDSVRFLYSLGNEIKTAKFGLETITALLGALGNPQSARRFVHVAGTNGKGSTCAMLEAALRASGLRTGLYTSPHLEKPEERVRIGGDAVTEESFAEALNRVHAAAEALIRDGRIERHPTYFETVTAMAFVLFRQAPVDIAVLETGLGGRLDATNVVTPAVSVITRVDFDHEALLGRSLEAIASEKAGILKPGVPAVFSPQRPEAGAVLRGRASALGCPVTGAEEWTIEDCRQDAHGSRFTARRGKEVVRVRCPLPGDHQVENAVTAVAALRVLDIPGGAIEAGIASVRWPGRLETVSTRPEIILDGAHNPSGARALVDFIRRFYCDRKVTLIYGAMRDKAVAEMASILFPAAASVIVTAPAQERATRPETILGLAGHPDIRIAGSVKEALDQVRGAGPEEAVFITGSLFVVAEARRLI
ncbi:MAG TPA: folylpolyglutamate synthase/dihydrofolate synthase family protein [Bryobacteraceae bacterium]|jgi:dihydrofolate synthase/folylpolyglutamate synthase|nr:folylpolyglutamate synthase/dihydrofolate synthase family protein [Bryobacteraceae bacterium]